MTWIVIVWMICLTVVVLFFMGARQTEAEQKEEENVILVKRVKPSFRNPAKTNRTSYEEYKTSKGLYAPIRQGKGSTVDEIDIGGGK